MIGYSLVFIPRSWHVGVWRRPHKTIYSLGPFRFAVHFLLGGWKPSDPVKEPFVPDPRRGKWLSGYSPSDLLVDGTPAGGALEPSKVFRTQGDASPLAPRAVLDEMHRDPVTGQLKTGLRA